MAEPFTGEPIGTVRDPNIWNADGTPRRPDLGSRPDGRPFADLAEKEEHDAYVNYAKMRAKAMANQAATVGDIVHWWDGQRCVAAIMVETAMFDGESDVLTTFPPDGGFMAQGVGQHDETKAVSTWHWPEPQ